MRAWGSAWSLLALTLLGGCSHFGLRPDLEPGVVTAAPTHPLKVALLPITDARQGRDGEEPDELYVYQGRNYRATRLSGEDDLQALTSAIGRHLARSRVFAQVILVLREDQAPEADLFLEGRLTRFRGYVEVEARPHLELNRHAAAGAPGSHAHPRARPAIPHAGRVVLAEVLLRNFRLRDRQGRVHFDGDVGWSIGEPRTMAVAELDPWGILAEALQIGLEAWIAEVRQAELSGAVVILPEVQAGTGTVAYAGLGAVLPPGWSAKIESSTTTPEGWRGPRGCEAQRLEQAQTFRFHRALGPYRPAVQLWRCSDQDTFRYDGRAEFPARYLGTTPGHRYFSRAVGESNWKDAEADLARILSLTPPSHRHLFELGPNAPTAPRPAVLPLPRSPRNPVSPVPPPR